MPRKRTRKARRSLDETVTKLLAMGAGTFAAMQPVFPGIILPDGRELEPNILQKVWTLDKSELNAISEPICEMLPDMPERTQEKLAKILNPIALLTAIYTIAMPRLQMQREITSYVRAYNAGNVQATGTPGPGLNVGGSPGPAGGQAPNQSGGTVPPDAVIGFPSALDGFNR